jgi:hypothetical protein
MEANRSSKLQLALKTLLALLAGAVVPALIVAVVATVSITKADAPSGPGSVLLMVLSTAGITFLVALAFTAAHTFVLGLPMVLLGVKLRAIRWWSCILVSFVIGFVPSAWASGSNFLSGAPIGGALGVIGGLTFWLVWHFGVQRLSSGAASASSEPVANPSAMDGG